MGRTLLRCLALAILLSLSRCTKSPEALALSCVQAMCADDRTVMKECLTEDSYRLFAGFSGVVPELTACQPDSLEVESVRLLDPEGTLARVALTGGAGLAQTVIMQRRDGEWRLELFMIGWDDTIGRTEMLSPGVQ